MPNKVKYKYTTEILEKVVKESLSVREVMTKLGISTISGGMHSYLKKRIQREGFDISHFRGKGANFGKNHVGGTEKLLPKQILVLNTGQYKTKSELLRRALIEIGREYICYICGLNDKWQGKVLKLEIEHKNGIVMDNRETNLEFICPNCHAQTETFCKVKKNKLPK